MSVQPRILSVTLLLLAMCLCFHVALGNLRRPSKHSTRFCCRRVAPSLSEQLKKTVKIYQRQEAKGHCVEAIVLQTDTGMACVSPNATGLSEYLNRWTDGGYVQL